MTIGDRIRTARLAIDITQAELGKCCGVSKQTIYKYENNIITNIPFDKVELMAPKLGVSVQHLMGWEEKERSEPEADSDLEEMTEIFNSLSEDNRAKLLELSRLYLDAQHKNV